jgi:hypothetical protein
MYNNNNKNEESNSFDWYIIKISSIFFIV